MSTPRVIFNVKFAAAVMPQKFRTPEQRAKYILNRAWYSCNDEVTTGMKYNNIVEYLSRGRVTTKVKNIDEYMAQKSKEKEYDPDEDFFNRDGRLNDKDMLQMMEKKKKTKSNIWHGWFSIEEEFGKQNCNTLKQAHTLMKGTFDAFLRDAGLNPKNIEWYACLHKDSKCRNVHFVFFEKAPKRVNTKTGALEYTRKGEIPKRALERNIVRMNLFYEENKNELSNWRDSVLNRINVIQQPLAQQDDRLKNELVELAKKLPADGRLSYASKNMQSLRKEIDALAIKFLYRDKELFDSYMKWCGELKKRDEKAFQIATGEKFENHKDMNANENIGLENRADVSYGNVNIIEELRKDMRTRLGNLIIKTCRELQLTPRSQDIKTHLDKGYGEYGKRRQARMQRANISSAFLKLCYALSYNAQDVFMQTRVKLLEIANKNEKQMEGMYS